MKLNHAQSHGDLQGDQALLHYAAMTGCTDLVEAVLSRVTDINAADRRDGTALCAASLQGHYESAKLLLSKGVAVNVKAGIWDTALNAAIFKGRLDIVKLLLSYGAHVNDLGWNSTPLLLDFGTEPS